MRILTTLICIFAVSCGDDDKAATVAPTNTEVDNSESAFQTIISDGDYKNWPAEAAIHSSTGPHGRVRTYANALLFESLTAGNTTHPVGSTAVKELYDSSDTITGYAIEMKSSEGSGGETWTWYEDFLSSEKIDFYGVGLSTCTGCHSSGEDFVTTPASLLTANPQ